MLDGKLAEIALLIITNVYDYTREYINILAGILQQAVDFFDVYKFFIIIRRYLRRNIISHSEEFVISE